MVNFITTTISLAIDYSLIRLQHKQTQRLRLLVAVSVYSEGHVPVSMIHVLCPMILRTIPMTLKNALNEACQNEPFRYIFCYAQAILDYYSNPEHTNK